MTKRNPLGKGLADLSRPGDRASVDRMTDVRRSAAVVAASDTALSIGQPTTRHFVLIDHYSGFVWGEADATGPIAACEKVDAALNGAGNRTYEHEILRDNRGGYHVFEAPAGWQAVEDGQDQAEIERVERDCTKVAEVAFTEIDDLPPINPETCGDNR